MNRENFKPGVRPSPPDNRDFTIAMASRAMGESFKENYPTNSIIHTPTPLNQGT